MEPEHTLKLPQLSIKPQRQQILPGAVKIEKIRKKTQKNKEE